MNRRRAAGELIGKSRRSARAKLVRKAGTPARLMIAVLPASGASAKLPPMTSAETIPHITEEEYLEGEQHSEVRHEYYDGQVYAMAGASDGHELVAGNVFANQKKRRFNPVFFEDIEHVRRCFAIRPVVKSESDFSDRNDARDVDGRFAVFALTRRHRRFKRLRLVLKR